MCVKNISAILILFISLSASAQTKQISYLKTKVDAANANDESLQPLQRIAKTIRISHRTVLKNILTQRLSFAVMHRLSQRTVRLIFYHIVPFSGRCGTKEIQEGKLILISISLLLTLATDNDEIKPPTHSENSERLLFYKFSGNQFV